MAAEGERARARARVQVKALMHECRHRTDWKSKQESLERALALAVQEVPAQLPELIQLVLEEMLAGGWEQRKYMAEVTGLIGFKFLDQVPVMVQMMLPTLVLLLRDHEPGVVMAAIVAAQKLLIHGFRDLVVQEKEAGKVDDELVEVWRGMAAVKELVAPMLGPGHDPRVRTRAVKYFEHQALLFSPTPERSGKEEECSVAWIEGRAHPVLVVSELGQEAVRSVDLLLDLLREPGVAKLSCTLVVLLFNSLENIARRRPSLLKMIVPVLINLGPRCDGLKEHLVSNDLMPNVVRWLWIILNRLLRPCQMHAADLHKRLLPVVKEMQSDSRPSRGQRVENERAGVDRRARDGRLPGPSSLANLVPELSPGEEDGVRKRSFTRENGGRVEGVDDRAKRSKLSPGEQELESATKLQQVVRPVAQDGRIPQQESMTLQQEQVEPQQEQMRPQEQSQLQQLIGMIAAMLERGEQGVQSCKILIENLTTDMLVDLCIANLVHLPAVRPSEESDPEPSAAGHTSGPAGVLPAVPVLESQHAAPEEELSVLDGVPAPTSAGSTRQALLPQAVLADHTASSPVTRSEEVSSMRDLRAATAIATEATTVSVTRDTTPSNGTQPAADLPRARFVPMRLGREPSSGSEIKEKGSDSESHPNPAALPPNSTWQATAPAATATTATRSDPGGVEEDSGSQHAVSTLGNGPEHERVPDSGSTLSGDVPTDEPQALGKPSLEHLRQSYMATSGDGGLQAGLISLLEGNASSLDFQDYYARHDGHALAMDVLTRLYSSFDRVAYENFFRKLCYQALHAFPPDSLVLAKLVDEAPFLPPYTLSLLDHLCKSEARVEQGLHITGLLVKRDRRDDDPRDRYEFLQFALHCAVHELEKLRQRAVDLVVEELYPLSCFSAEIEAFAMGRLDQSKVDRENPLRTVSLFLALCSKNPELLSKLFPVYGDPLSSSNFRCAVKIQVIKVVSVIGRGPSVSALREIINYHRHARGCQQLIKAMHDPDSYQAKGEMISGRGDDQRQGRKKGADERQGRKKGADERQGRKKGADEGPRRKRELMRGGEGRREKMELVRGREGKS